MSAQLTNEMLRVLRIAERSGAVVAGRGEHAGHVEVVHAPTIAALIKRGLLVHIYGSEGGYGGRLTEAGRDALGPTVVRKTRAQLDAEIADADLLETLARNPGTTEANVRSYLRTTHRDSNALNRALSSGAAVAVGQRIYRKSDAP